MQFLNIHTHRPTGRHIEPSFAGMHPWDADKVDERDFCNFRKAVVDADFAGETGLDYCCKVPHDVQEQLFRRQLQTAEELRKPVVLHCVRAFEPVMKVLADYTLPAVVFHGFIGSEQQAARAVGCGYFLSFGPHVFRSPRSLQALKTTPLPRLFLETDDSETAIEEVYRLAAEVRGTTVEELQAAILENYEQILKRNEKQLVGTNRTAAGR